MSWFPVDDAFHSHPKARKAGLEAIGLWSVSGSYCMAYLTDGFVPEWFVKEKPRGLILARRLIAANMWITAEKDGEQGFQFHKWKRECMKDVVLAAREKARQRKAKSRESQQESHRDDTCDDLRESRDMSGPTQPNPTQLKEFFGYVPEAASLSNAQDAIAATPGAELVRKIIPDEHPDAVRTALRINASALIKSGTSSNDVAAALELWLTKPHLGPNALSSLVSEVIKSSTPHINGLTPGEAKVIGWAELGKTRNTDQEAIEQ